MDSVKTIDLFARPQRNEKGQFIQGNTMNADNPPELKGGRLCEFCPKHEEVLKKVKLFKAWCSGKLDKKIRVPFLEELCDEDYLDILVDELEDWCNRDIKEMPHDPNHNPIWHTELSRAVAKLFQNQRQWLKKRTLTAQQTAGPIFLLKANHNMMESEKKIIAGDPENPQKHKLEIEITEAKKNG